MFVTCTILSIMKNIKTASSKKSNHQVASEGRSLVESELRKRGVRSITLEGTRKIYLQASNLNSSRTVHIRVKTKRKGNWHSKIDEAEAIEAPQNPQDVRQFWVFVNLGDVPGFWVIPNWWIRNDIYEAHQAYLNRYGGRRAKTQESNHHSIDENRLEQWKGKWEILGIFD